MHSWFSYIKGKTTITDKHCSHVSWNQSFWQRKKRKKVRFLYNLFSKSEPFQCTGTVGKYPVFIFGIFQIVGGACQAGIMKNSWYAGGKKCQILSCASLCECGEKQWLLDSVDNGDQSQEACVLICLHVWIDTENRSVVWLWFMVQILAFSWMGRLFFHTWKVAWLD